MATHVGTTDDLLSKLAEDIETGEQMEGLGRSLGFKHSAINRYTETNNKGDRVTCKGTRDMLFDWRQTVEPAFQHSRLKQAFIDAHLVMLAKTHLEGVSSTPDIFGKKISESLTVGQCREKLRHRYLDKLCKIQLRPWDKSNYAELKDLHTVVTMMRKDSSGIYTKKKEELEGSVDKIFSTKVNGRLPSRILISAPAGVGKTTAVAKIAYDWAQEKKESALEQLPLLFAVRFRNTGHRTSIGEAIKAQLLSDIRDLKPDDIESFIRENQEICHIILDGLDEYAGISSLNNIVSVIRCDEFPQCRVLITTRPHLESYFNQDDLPKVYTKMWIEGFSMESSREYIDRFFTLSSSDEKRDKLKEYLNDQPLIDELAKTPLLCLMICHLWSEDQLGSDVSTQTDLFDSVNTFLMHHANARSGLTFTHKNLDEIVNEIGRVALYGLLDDAKKLIFTLRDFRRVPRILDEACELGIVSKTTVPIANLPQSDETTSTQIEFYHKLAQEHSAGKFIGSGTRRLLLRLRVSKLDRILWEINSNIGDYEQLIRFVCGIDRHLGIRIMEALLENENLEENERYRILLDCSSEFKDSGGDMSSLVQRCVTAQSIILKSPTIYTVVGLRNLPKRLQREVKTMRFMESVLTTDVTRRMWFCLTLFPSLNTISITDSSLSFPSSLPKLSSFTHLSGERMTPSSYKSVLSSLPNARELNVSIAIKDNSSTFEITSDAKRTKKKLHRQHSMNTINVTLQPCVSQSLGEVNLGLNSGGFALLFGKKTEIQHLLSVSGDMGRYGETLVDLFVKTTRLTYLNSPSLASTHLLGHISKCKLSEEMTSRLWSGLRSFNSLNHLCISDSSLSFPSSSIELSSVTKLSTEKVTSQCYKGLISSLPCLVNIDITIDDAEGDINQITDVLRQKGGQRLEQIILRGISLSPPSRNVVRPGLLLKKHADGTKMLKLDGSGKMNEEGRVELLESLAYLASLAYLQLEFLDGSSFNFEATSGVENNLPILHIAVLRGDASLVDKLISYGCDLNTQSTDGQTCLHKAIKLCYMTERTVKETETLKKISNEYYNGALPPEKALVFYLLDNGARLDIKDEAGNLPIHYAKDYVINQMILLRSPTEDIAYSKDAPPSTSNLSVEAKRANNQEVDLGNHDVSICIPPGAVLHDDKGEITLTLLRELPGVELHEDESVACYGIRCDPPNTVFVKPVKIRIPHSSVVINPDQVKPDIVSRVWDSVKDLPRTSRQRSSNSSDEPPYCRVYERHLELYIGHCAEWWVLITLEQQVIRQKLMCTPYIPDKIDRGEEFAVNLQMHSDLPGAEAILRDEAEQQLYHRCHRSVPFSVETRSGDVTVTCQRDGEEVESQVFPARDLQTKMNHCVVLYVSPRTDDVDFTVITITVAQSGKYGISRSIAFVIRYRPIVRPDNLPPLEQTSLCRTLEEVEKSDLQSDIDVLTIAQTMDVNQFYDMGIALGFTIAELNRIEYRRLRDRQQATFDMLVAWRGRQESILAAKNTLIALMESLQSSATDSTFSGIAPTEEIPDSTLLQVARRISKDKFYEIGYLLDFDKTELEHIEHRSLYNRKDANIQMLSIWKASQTSMDEGEEKLQMVWKSVTEASRATRTNDAGDETDGETSLAQEENQNPSHQDGSELDEGEDHEDTAGNGEEEADGGTPQQGSERHDDEEKEKWKIVEYTESDQDESVGDIDMFGGSPSNGELCGVVRVVGNLTTALDLSRALRVDDNDIIDLLTPSNPALMERIAWQLINRWCTRLGKLEKEEKLARLFQGYNIEDTQKDISEISKKIHTNPDLLHLSQLLGLSASEILQVMALSLTLELAMIRQVVLQLLQIWVRQGGKRLRLLEIAKCFHLNDAAEQIATAISQHPGFPDSFTHATIDHNGGELKLHDLGIRISIPSGAISKGMRSVATLCVPRSHSFNIPLDDGEVLVTYIIRCSFLQELRKPAAVTLPHCIISERYQQKKEDMCLKLYTKLGQGRFGCRAIESSKDFDISEDRITFSTYRLQYFALSSNDVRGIQFICEVSQPLFRCNTPQPTLRIRIAHPFNKDSVEFRPRNDSRSQEIFYQVTNVIKFTLDSAEDDIMLLCVSDSKKTQETVHVGSLLSGGCIIAHFNLPPSSSQKSVSVCIEQGSSTLAEGEIHISSEVEPNYEQTHRRGRIRFVSNHMLNMLSGLVCQIKEACELGYKLGLSYSTVEKYLVRADSSARSVSRSGLKEMLQDWRRRVRPSEQVNQLRLALEAAGLRRESEVIFQEN